MKTLVVFASTILLAFSAQNASAKPQNGYSPAGYYQSVPENKLSRFYCTVTIDGVLVMDGIAEGYSAEELENKIKAQYTEIFRDGDQVPEIKVTCTLVQKKKINCTDNPNCKTQRGIG